MSAYSKAKYAQLINELSLQEVADLFDFYTHGYISQSRVLAFSIHVWPNRHHPSGFLVECLSLVFALHLPPGLGFLSRSPRLLASQIQFRREYLKQMLYAKPILYNMGITS